MNLTRLPSRALLGLAVVLPLAAVGVALYTQHALDMQPCPWCVFQRALFCAVALAALSGLALPGSAGRLSGAGIALLSLGGVAAALWQHFVAAASASCNQSLAEQVMSALGLSEALPKVFMAYASCSEAAVKLFGLPYEFYSLALFVLLAALGVRLLLARR